MLQLETTFFKRSEHNSRKEIQMHPGKLRVATTTHIYYLDVKDIVRIQSISNYSKLFFTSGQTLLVAKVLAWFDELLTTRSFLRVHRTHLVNLHYLKQYVPGSVAIAALTNNEEVPVSRRKKKLLQQKMILFTLQRA